MSPAICFDLDESEIVSSSNGLKPGPVLHIDVRTRTQRLFIATLHHAALPVVCKHVCAHECIGHCV